MTKKNGFTLIETMVAVVIFTVVMSLVMAVFMVNVKNQRASIYRQKLITETSYIMNYMAKELTNGSNYTYSSENKKISFTNSNGISVSYARVHDTGMNIYRIRETKGGKDQYITSEILKVKIFLANIDKGIMQSEKITFVLETEIKTGEGDDDKAGIKLQTTIKSR